MIANKPPSSDRAKYAYISRINNLISNPTCYKRLSKQW